jgi:hypothetical protein
MMCIQAKPKPKLHQAKKRVEKIMFSVNLKLSEVVLRIALYFADRDSETMIAYSTL